MNKLKAFTLSLILTLTALAFAPSQANATNWAGEKFQVTKYFCGTTAGTGNHSGVNPSNCLPIVDETIFTIEAKSVIEHVYMIITTAITGTTDLDIGDGNSGNGFLDGSLSLTFATPGVYGYQADLAGSYLRATGLTTSPAASLKQNYYTPQLKFYSASTPMLMDVTTANTAGAFQVVIEGYKYK